MKRQLIGLVRKCGLGPLADKFRYYFLLQKTSNSRRLFRKKNPHAVLPPDYFLYETFGLSYTSYYEGGEETARWLIQYFKRYVSLENEKILDWGCGLLG